LMWAALHVANIDAPNAGEYCLRCHTPKGWYEGRSHPADGSALQTEDINSGVACALCHRMVDPVPSTTNDEAVELDQAIRTALANPVPLDFIGSGALIVDPNDNRRGPFSFNNSLSYHSAYQTDFLGQAGEAITQARVCGSCHNVYNPVLSWDSGRGQYWPNEMDAPAPDFGGDALFPIETTFQEWLLSDFADTGVYAPEFAGQKADGIVRTCQDCHMPRSSGYAADLAFTPVYRNCVTTGCLPEHSLVGGNAWVPQLLQNPLWRLSAESESAYLNATILQAETMLQKAATLTVTLTTSDTVKLASVRVINHTGHKLPTGYPEGRQMWINLQAFDSSNQLVYESGAYNSLTGQLDRDVDVKVYEAKQGITPELASVLGLNPGESFHFVLNNTVIKDNRIPPQGYTQAIFDQPGLRPVGATYLDGQYWDDTVYTLPLETDRVLVTLYYQTSSKEYINFLQSNGGVDGLTLGQLWADSKSPPQIMAQAWIPDYLSYYPIIMK
jgi:mono/diheme cytochrome c family protein